MSSSLQCGSCSVKIQDRRRLSNTTRLKCDTCDCCALTVAEASSGRDSALAHALAQQNTIQFPVSPLCLWLFLTVGTKLVNRRMTQTRCCSGQTFPLPPDQSPTFEFGLLDVFRTGTGCGEITCSAVAETVCNSVASRAQGSSLSISVLLACWAPTLLLEWLFDLCLQKFLVFSSTVFQMCSCFSFKRV